MLGVGVLGFMVFQVQELMLGVVLGFRVSGLRVQEFIFGVWSFRV